MVQCAPIGQETKPVNGKKRKFCRTQKTLSHGK
jgi:hypothetical protein